MSHFILRNNLPQDLTLLEEFSFISLTLARIYAETMISNSGQSIRQYQASEMTDEVNIVLSLFAKTCWQHLKRKGLVRTVAFSVAANINLSFKILFCAVVVVVVRAIVILVSFILFSPRTLVCFLC